MKTLKYRIRNPPGDNTQNANTPGAAQKHTQNTQIHRNTPKFVDYFFTDDPIIL